MAVELRNYDPKDVTVIYSGAIIKGFAPGVFIDVFRTSPEFVDFLGCDGEVTRVNTKDSRGTIVIRLLQTSLSNLVFSTFNNGDNLTGLGALPLLIVDKGGKNVYAAAEAWVNGPRRKRFSNNIEFWEWRLRANNVLFQSTGGSG